MADPNEYKLDPALSDIIYETIKSGYIGQRQAQDAPRFVMIVAQTGAGKSTLFTMIDKSFSSHEKPVHADMDLLRDNHPEISDIYEKHPFDVAFITNPDAWIWTSRLLDDAKSGRHHIIYETALRSIDDVETTIKTFQGEGYAVDLHTIAVNSKKSIFGIFERYERQILENKPARFVAIDYHDSVYAGLGPNVHRLEKGSQLDVVSVYTRDGKQIYVNDGSFADQFAQDFIHDEQDRPWDQFEKEELARNWKALYQRICRREQGPKPENYVTLARGFLKEAVLFERAKEAKSAEVLDFKNIRHVTHHHVFVLPENKRNLVCYNKKDFPDLSKHFQNGLKINRKKWPSFEV